ncbi:MAG: hypothetical protein WBD99_03830 [Thermodesulfobacteriota bacterium]
MTRTAVLLTLALSFMILITLIVSYSCMSLMVGTAAHVARSAHKSRVRAECDHLGGILIEDSTSEWKEDTCIKMDEEGNVQVLFKPIPKPTPAPMIK